MQKTAKLVIAASTLAMLLGTMALAPQVAVADEALAAKGKKIAENRKKGNCFTCHEYKGAHLAGNVGPPLVAMKSRFPDKAKLRAQIWDSTATNPATMMPPFGKHEILSEKEIDAITEWVYSL
ncbi:Sulfur oxidation protein SoxX [hydrothermal vent metagenome]|uniref:Sulfur oxidation protein SoxX n=1 Tax=hydrothermal vent metagenome TaxID=652676 RepID=A0A3B1BVN7_9ZZZZ